MRFVLSDGLREYDFLSGGDIYVASDGLTLPIPGLEGTYQESNESEGRRRIGDHPQNGEGSFRVHFKGDDHVAFWSAVDDLQELVASAHRRKGTITYEPGNGAAEVTWDLELIRVSGLPEKTVHTQQRHGDAEVQFEVRPYARLAEREIVEAVTLAGPIDSFEVEGVGGQVDAFGRLELTDLSSQARPFVEIGVQDEAGTEPLIQQAVVDLTALSGQPTTRSGSFSTNVIRGILTSSSPSAVCQSSPLPHKGLWKVRGRVFASASGCRVRLAWRVGSGGWSRERWVSIPAGGAWYDVDLGTIDIRELPEGHSWMGRVEGQCLSGLPTVDVDLASFIPADRYFCGRGVTVMDVATGPVVAADDFDSHAPGTLNGKTPPQVPSGNWSGAGGLEVGGLVPGQVVRWPDVDSAWAGVYARCGDGTATDTRVRVDYEMFDTTGAPLSGVFARYQDANNWLLAVAQHGGFGSIVQLVKRISGTVTVLATALASGGSGLKTLELLIGSNGVAEIFQGAAGTAPARRLTFDCGAQFRAGGVRASGGYGFYDQAAVASLEAYRSYDNFVVFAHTSAAAPSPAINPGKSMVLSHDDALTEADTETGRTPIREGQYLLLPPATRAGQKSRVVVRARRGDLTNREPDDGLSDTLRASLSVTERVTLGRA